MTVDYASPYFIEGPALISFSGGRTSAFMLHGILQAYDGQLPEDVVVAFANTGKEREETLRFVHECGLVWGVPIHWVERRLGGGRPSRRLQHRVAARGAVRGADPPKAGSAELAGALVHLGPEGRANASADGEARLHDLPGGRRAACRRALARG